MLIEREKILSILMDAGRVIMQYYRTKMDVRRKADHSPVTQADLLANEIIVKGLQELYPDYPILSEEMPIAPFSERKTWQQYWVVDPLDGTQDFLAETDEFCVCIALIERGRVVLSALHAPVSAVSYFAKKGEGVWRSALGFPCVQLSIPSIPETLRLISSRIRPSKRLQNLAFTQGFSLQSCGSALKFIKLIEGEAELFIRLGSSYIWDVAVGVLFLEELGGLLLGLDRCPLDFSPQETLWCPPFVATIHLDPVAALWPKFLELKS